MARNGVAANLLLFLIVAAGLVSLGGLEQEAFPVIAFDAVEVLVPYPGATPDEVEQSIAVRIEEAVGSLNGVREVASVAAEGVASVIVTLAGSTDVDRAADAIRSAVDRISTLPAGAERPRVRKMTNRQSVIRLVLYGDVPERALKELAYGLEDQLRALPEVSLVQTTGVRPYEISIETPQRRLRAHGLTIGDIADAVRAGALDLSAGSLETRETEVRVRTIGSRHDQQDFEEIVVLSRNDGTLVRLGDIAMVRDGFREVETITRHQGQPAALVDVYRSAGEKVLAIADAVETHVRDAVAPALPEGVAVAIWSNDAENYRSRLRLLLENGLLGLILVLAALALFIEIRLAVWVVVGMAVSFVGALAAALALGVSINTSTLFAFVLAVGIVVDDAIMAAEKIHAERRRGRPGVAAAIRGTRRIARPLVFAVLTTIAAFAPLLFVPGPIGKLVAPIPIILIAILLLSLIESLFILPNHLSHLPAPDSKPTNFAERFFSAINRQVERRMSRFVEGPLDRGLRFATLHPQVVIAGGAAAIVVAGALVPAGIVAVAFAPSAESDIVTARLETPEGTPARKTDEIAVLLEEAAYRASERLSAGRAGDAPPLVRAVHRAVGMAPRSYGGSPTAAPGVSPPGHVAVVECKLLEGERRRIGANEFVQAWREEAGDVPGASSLTFSAELVDFGAAVHVELSHPGRDRLALIGQTVVDRLRRIEGVADVRSDHAEGVEEIGVRLLPRARSLGLTLEDLARQVRAAFFGEEAVRVQRSGEEVRVYARLPAAERDAVSDLGGFMVRIPSGSYVPFAAVASADPGSSATSIRRKDGRRVLAVTANVDPAAVAASQVIRELENAILPSLQDRDPDLAWSFGGQQQVQADSVGNLAAGFGLALFLIYALLAVPLRSWTRPLIIMAVIPFGVVGAILGHLIVGIGLTAASIWGILGLTGVVVNDSLMMVDFIAERLERAPSARAAIIDGAKARFRPIFLTSLTTFLGFAPLIFERSPQAQILIPTAVSLGFGLVITTGILMLLVPALWSVSTRSKPRPVGPHGATR